MTMATSAKGRSNKTNILLDNYLYISHLDSDLQY